MEVLKMPIIQIGGSKGIRIPKKILEECHITDSVTATVEDGRIILVPEAKPRQGWAEAAKKMRKAKEDALLIDDRLDLHLEEWEW